MRPKSNRLNKKLSEMSWSRLAFLSIVLIVIGSSIGAIISGTIAVKTGTASLDEGIRIGISCGAAPAIGLILGLALSKIMIISSLESEERLKNQIREIVQEELSKQQINRK